MTPSRLAVIGLVTVALASVPCVAYGYASEATPEMIERLPAMQRWFPDPGDPGSWIQPDPDTDCWICHGTQAADEPSGPHGGYLATTNKCAVCHSIHVAPAASGQLLPAATVKDTCETCHDGTAGQGVYGAIAARGLTVVSAHRIVETTEPTTTNIPGGDGATGESRTVTFSGPGGNLTCSDCHSPHATNVVEPFTGDRARSSLTTVVTSTRLLKRRPTSASADAARYGSDWCGGCHQGRLSGSGPVGNHPVESSVTQTQTAPFHYENIVRVTGNLTSSVELGTLGRNNRGYVMPDKPRSGLQAGHYPICQQCHEDVRNVGDQSPQQIDPTEQFVISALDGQSASDNPRFQVFPHESTTRRLLVETDDDLCLNCHGQPD